MQISPARLGWARRSESQHYLSSTARDLTTYRDAVTEAIHRLDGFHCVRMEDFGARDAQADDFCQAKIAACDVAVFIVGLCYGSSPADMPVCSNFSSPRWPASGSSCQRISSIPG